MVQIITNLKNRKKYNILFISSDWNYFVNNNASFSRMYNILLYFHNHEDFNVFVLQPDKDKKSEDFALKKKIKTYYFKEIRVFGKGLMLFVDLNPFYVYGINCLRLFRKIPISYNAYNIETIFFEQVGKLTYYNVNKLIRYIASKYIPFLEKNAVKSVKNINAVSLYDKKKLMEMHRIPGNKIIVSPFGYNLDIFKNPIDKDKAKKKFIIQNYKFVIVFHGNKNTANLEAVCFIENDIAPKVVDSEIIFLIA